MSRNLALATALAGGLLIAATAPAWAQAVTYGATGGEGFGDGGDGGDSGQAGTSGTSVTPGIGGAAGTSGSPNGGDGTNGGGGGGGYSNIFSGDISSSLNGGNGGNGGNGADGDGGGGAGGDGAVGSALILSVSADVAGGDGGCGGGNTGSLSCGGGSAGGGGAGVVLTSNGEITVGSSAEISGGDGGGAGFNDIGGGGGAGVIMMNGGLFINDGAVKGGAGGNGADGGAGLLSDDYVSVTNHGTIVGGFGPIGGSGGAAVDLSGGGTVYNTGVIEGGGSNGPWGSPSPGLPVGGAGSGGASGFDPSKLLTGAPGDGIIGADLTVINYGMVKGGIEGTGSGQANAITFTGGVNRLSLRAGSTIIGVVDATAAGTDDTLELGGMANATFDLNSLGATAQYRGFEHFEKTGTSTWTLTGNGAVGLFSLHEGTVVVDGGTLNQPVIVTPGARSFIGQNSGDNATLFISGGGTVSVDNKVHIGDLTNSRGSVVVTGDGSSLEVRDLTVGFAGEGNLFVVNGGDFLSNAFLNVGGGNYFQLGTGRLDVSGTGSSAKINGLLTIAGFGDGSTGVVTVSNGGVLDVAAVRMSNDNPSGSAEFNIGAASTDPNDAVAPGTLHTSGLRFFHDNARLNFNHTGTAYVFDTPLGSTYAGAGFVHHYAGDTILTGDSSGFSGNTIVHDGTLSVNGTLGGVVDVASGGTLGGSGAVGTTTVAAGGTIAPGNSIGVLTVNGNYTQKAGSTYQAEIDPMGNADLLDVTGTATIEGGTVFALKAPGGYSVGTRYTLLSAVGGVTGTYGTLDQNAPFVALKLAYDPGNVYLDVTRNAVKFCDVAATRNQCATGKGAESTKPGNRIYDVIAGLPSDKAARDAFDQLSGELHASIKDAMLHNSRFAREVAMTRARAGAGGQKPRPRRR